MTSKFLFSCCFFLSLIVWGETRIFSIEDSDFRLQDSRGDSYLMSYGEKTQAVVLLAWPASCESSAEILSWFSELEKKFKDKPVRFYWLNSFRPQDEEKVNQQINHQFQSPVLMDYSQTVTKSFQLKKAGDFVVLLKNPWRKEKQGDWNSGDLEKILGELFSVSSDSISHSKGLSCALALQEEPMIWDEHIALSFFRNCVRCHGSDGSPQHIFKTDEDVFNWTAASRVNLRLALMPPTAVDNRDQFANCAGERFIRPRQDELSEIQNWLEGGARHPKEPTHFLEQFVKELRAQSKPLSQHFSQPGLVLTTKELAKEGEDEEDQVIQLAGPMKEDIHVAAFRVNSDFFLHHVQLYVLPRPLSQFLTKKQQMPRRKGESLVPLNPYASLLMEPDGRFVALPGYEVEIKKGSFIVIDSHFYPHQQKKKGKVGLELFFSKEQKRPAMHALVETNHPSSIPAGEAHFVYQTELKIKEDVSLVEMLAHTHSRGVAAEVKMRTKEGREELVCRLPHRDAHFRNNQIFIEPVFLPKGSTLSVRYTFDNSVDNPNNPDSAAVVKWRMILSDEMATTHLYFVKGHPGPLRVCWDNRLGCPLPIPQH